MKSRRCGSNPLPDEPSATLRYMNAETLIIWGRDIAIFIQKANPFAIAFCFQVSDSALAAEVSLILPRQRHSERITACQLYTHLAIAGIAVLGIVAGTYCLSPHLFLRSLSNAVINENAASIEADVDFEAVRDGLKEQLGLLLAEQALGKVRKHASRNNFASLILPSLGNSVIDAVATPTGMVAILRQRVPQTGQGNHRPSMWRGHSSWINLDHFRASYSNKLHPDEEIAVTLERQHGLQWKLVRLDLPLDRMAERAGF